MNIDILPDILYNDIPRIRNEESIKFLVLFSYPNPGNKTNGGWESRCGEWVVPDGLGRKRRGAGPHDILRVSDVQQKFLWRVVVVDGGSSEECFIWGGGVIKEPLLKQFKRRVGKGINDL